VFRLGYNTNGLAHHRVPDALALLAELGYEGVALTPDAGALDPFHLRPGEVEGVRDRARDLGLTLALETGSRFLLDPGRKHHPNLLDADPAGRERRLDFLRRCVDLAADLGAGVVSFWAGVAPGGEVADTPLGKGNSAHGLEPLWDRLAAGTSALLEHGRGSGVRIALEPEPGMFLERPAGLRDLLERLGTAGDDLGLCLDIGHLVVTGDLPVGRAIGGLEGRLAMVHLDDARRGEHVHRMFGEGELDLKEALSALKKAGYEGMAAVELSRDSARGPAAATEAMEHLRRAMPGPE